jgi:hypothetical protein
VLLHHRDAPRLPALAELAQCRRDRAREPDCAPGVAAQREEPRFEPLRRTIF